MKKEDRIAFRVSVEDFKKINANAKNYDLATGTYLRLLGLRGGNPFEAKELSHGAVYQVEKVVEKQPGHIGQKDHHHRKAK